MDMGILIIFIIFLFIDLILIYKPVPILAFPIMLFFIYIGIFNFYPLSDSILPMNPITSVFFLILCSLGILVNGLDVRR